MHCLLANASVEQGERRCVRMILESLAGAVIVSVPSRVQLVRCLDTCPADLARGSCGASRFRQLLRLQSDRETR